MKSHEVKLYVPPIPFLQRLKRRANEVRYQKFLEMFKKLQVNIPFDEAIANMPAYAKFLKEIMSNNQRLEEFATIQLSERCSVMIQSRFPIRK